MSMQTRAKRMLEDMVEDMVVNMECVNISLDVCSKTHACEHGLGKGRRKQEQ